MLSAATRSMHRRLRQHYHHSLQSDNLSGTAFACLNRTARVSGRPQHAAQGSAAVQEYARAERKSLLTARQLAQNDRDSDDAGECYLVCMAI